MRIRRISFAILITIFTLGPVSYGSFFWTPSWIRAMQKDVQTLEKEFNGEFGVYIVDLEDNDAFSYNSTQFWYLSSTIKVPVAVALLQLVDQKKLSLKDKVTINKEDYRDGAGPVNWLEPGSKVTYKYLLDQMLIYSDNAATDLIIKKVGLDNVNKLVQKYGQRDGFGSITTLLDVRKKAYGNMHPKAADLSNTAFLRIKKKRGKKKRTAQLAKELKIKTEQFKEPDLTKAFFKYYDQRWNSATLEAYAEFLKNILKQKMLSEKSTHILLKTMTGIQTGKKRIRKGLSKKFFFTHKTGTQHRQACDIGIAGEKKKKYPRILILVCTKNWKKLSEAEKLMAKVAKALSHTELLNRK